MVGDMILYRYPAAGVSGQGKMHKLAGPFVAQIIGGYRRDVPDSEVREYVDRMHGAGRGSEAVLERVPRPEGRDD